MEDRIYKLSEDNNDHLLNTYPVGDPEHPDWYIYEYENHRKVLVERDPKSGQMYFVREL